MNIIYEKSLWNFRNECRADVKKIIEKLKEIGKLDELEHELNMEYFYGISDIALHDLFIEDFDYLLSLINMTEKEFFNESAEE